MRIHGQQVRMGHLRAGMDKGQLYPTGVWNRGVWFLHGSGRWTHDLAGWTLAVSVDGKNIVMVEGIAQPDGRLEPIQEAFLEHGAVQCCFCTPGMVLMGKSLLNENPCPTEKEIRDYIRGNICR